MADVNNFYFKDFTGDYYLSKDSEGISHLKVEEDLTAVFPNFNQNKGICRQIPFTNQNGANITLDELTKDNITVLRNGLPEPIWSISYNDDYYEVCTGTDDYLLGEQVYTFKYTYDRVITDFSDYQELYWDTNGNGSLQRFGSLTANLHFVGAVKKDYQDLSWCYVGKYGTSGQDRCVISELSDGVSFHTGTLTPGENLTFDVQFNPDSFVVPEPVYNYGFVWLTLMTTIICLLLLIIPTKKYLKVRDKIKYYKDLFTKPEFTPSAKYSIAEMTEIYLGKKHDVKVGVLLDLIVKKKVSLIKKDASGRKAAKWALKINSLDESSEPAYKLLKILNNNEDLEVGDEIEIKKRTETESLVRAGKNFKYAIKNKIIADKLVKDTYTMGEAANDGRVHFSEIVLYIFFILPLLVGVLGFLYEFADVVFRLGVGIGAPRRGVIVAVPEMALLTGAVLLVTTITWLYLSGNARKYANLTKLGLEQSKYMEGLRLYIKMAEKERLELLQSVEGADVSDKGIVKLYEKLLPYAAVFGLEKSWMKGMAEYCEVHEVESPEWLVTGITVSEISRFANTASSYVNSSTSFSSSGGSYSSGSSGGGGGGFSGGGGGGGGTSGR